VVNGTAVIAKQLFIQSAGADVIFKVQTSNNEEAIVEKVKLGLNPRALGAVSAFVSTSRTYILKPTAMSVRLNIDLHAMFSTAKVSQTTIEERYESVIQNLQEKEFASEKVATPTPKKKIVDTTEEGMVRLFFFSFCL
jgi:hypothetical protein